MKKHPKKPHDNFRRKLFVQFLFEESTRGNATAAARKAGYKCPRQAGARLLSKAIIRKAINLRLKRLAMPADEVLARISEHARADLGDFLTIKGQSVRVDIAKAKRAGKTGLLIEFAMTKYGPKIKLGAPPSLEVLAKICRLIGSDDPPSGPTVKPPEVIGFDYSSKPVAPTAEHEAGAGDDGECAE